MVKNASHTLAYSLIALQEMNLAFKYPIIFWNCACLISDSGGNEEEEEETEIKEESDDDDEDTNEETTKEKKKTRNTNYGKISTAIGTMQHAGISVSPPDINKSSFTFIPDVEKNTIIYGIKGITKVGQEVVSQIIENRPYTSINDFLSKVKLNKTQMVNLIKSGAFDQFGTSRYDVMSEYINLIADKKKRLTLQNMAMLIEHKLLPDSLNYEVKVYNFNKYLKKNKANDYYLLDEISFPFYEENYNLDILSYENDEYLLYQKDWDKIYKKEMDTVRDYIKGNTEDLLNKLNQELFEETWNKYCGGSISKWEMDSISFYYHEHELANLSENLYEVCDFTELPEEPEIDKVIYMNGREVPLFKLYRIAGTVLDKNKTKNSISLLTNYGVVNVKIYQAQFAKFDKQISQKMADGHKKVLEKSWFSRGNKLLLTGIRRGDTWIPKKYKNSKYQSVIELITDIYDDGTIMTKKDRIEVEE